MKEYLYEGPEMIVLSYYTDVVCQSDGNVDLDEDDLG